MQFHRNGQLDDRRRRVLTEEVIASAGAEVATDGPVDTPRAGSTRRRASAKTSRYGDAAFMDRQMRVTDLVPKSYLIITLWFFAGLAAIAGLEALYWSMPAWAEVTNDGRIAAFDLDGEGGLGTWFSSMQLALASVIALLVYSIRKHRLDDYHGRYRIWLWAAACWMLLSIDEGGSLHEGFKELMTYLTGHRVLGDGSIWWAGAYVVLLGYVGVRLLIDMLECRLSSAAFIAVAICYSVAVATQMEFILPQSGARGIMLEEGLEMLGNLFLILAMTLHARHVILDAEGTLPAKAEKPAAEPKKTSRASQAKAAETTANQSAPAPVRRGWFGRGKPAAPAEPAVATNAKSAANPPTIRRSDLTAPEKAPPARNSGNNRVDAAHEDSAGGSRKLSKAERRAMRRQQRDREYDDD